MAPYWWDCALLLAFLAAGPSQRTVFADNLQELSRSVRWRQLALDETRPDDLTIAVSHNASTLRYAEWVYGTPDSPRIAIAVAETGDGGFVLYADKNRDREIRQRDLVEGTGELRELTLAAQQVVGDGVERFPRQVLFCWEGDHTGLRVATTTRIEHRIHPVGDETGRTLKTRQIDGNANGLFADTQDLLQIDLNHDDRFDPFLETFPSRPVMQFRGQRWFVRADRFGKRLRLELATATGRVRVATEARSKQDRITDLIVTLSGEDGSVYSLTGVNTVMDLPVGRYAVSALFVRIKPAGADRAWEFTFSRSDGSGMRDWLSVSEAKTVEFDPIGDLVLDAVVERSKRGETRSLTVQPRLFTGSGLLINLCRIEGMSSRLGPQCLVSLTHAGDQSLDQAASGFS